MTTDMEKLVIAEREFNSRLFLGTGKFNSDEVMEQSILASGTEMVTVAMKRIELDNKEDNMLVHIQHPGIQLLPNTSGVRNVGVAGVLFFLSFVMGFQWSCRVALVLLKAQNCVLCHSAPFQIGRAHV